MQRQKLPFIDLKGSYFTMFPPQKTLLFKIYIYRDHHPAMRESAGTDHH